MSELTIRRDNMTFIPPTIQAAAKTERASSAAPAQKTAEGKTVNISDTLQELMTRIGQAEGELRGSRNILQTGQAILDEVQESLDRIAELTQEAVEGEEPDREAIQEEINKLADKIDRMLSGASAGDKALFLKGKADLIEGLLSGEIDLDEVLDAVKNLLKQLADGVPQEDVLGALDMGSPLLKLLTGIGGMNSDLLMNLLMALESSQTALAVPNSTPAEAAPAETAAPQTAEATAAADVPAGSVQTTIELGGLRVTGQDLSGVTFDETANEVTVAGKADVTVQGTRQGEPPAVRLAGSGTVTLQDVKAPVLTVASPEAKVVLAGENQMGELRMEPEAALTVEGGGLLRLDNLQGDASNLLRLSGGSVILPEEDGQPRRVVTVPIVVEGAAALMAQAASVSSPEGKALEPFDLMWKTIMSGMSAMTSLEVDGEKSKQSLLNDNIARLWLDKGDPNHGFTVHTLVIQGKDEAGRLRSRYAYLRWNQKEEKFEEITMYPNPFTVTGGEEGEDWVYEEESQTLRILTSQVIAIAGGQGVDAENNPFSGRLRLADHIALLTLVLDGVECRVDSGKAFDLGQDNEVYLTLASGSKNVFESGEGFWGISMGEDSHVNIGYAEGPVGILSATIGEDLEPEELDEEEEPEVTEAPKEEEGIPLRMGGGSVTLPQFPLSSDTLRLDMLRTSTQEYARASMAIVNADRHWVAQIQSVYQALSGHLERSAGGFSGGCQAAETPAQGPVRDANSAAALVDSVRRSVLLQPELASYIHSRRGRAELHRLVK